MKDPIQSAFVKIAGLENAIEAQFVGFILDEQGIPHRIRSYHDTAYDGLFQLQKGWGEIQAPESFKKTIREVLHAVREEGKTSSSG